MVKLKIKVTKEILERAKHCGWGEPKGNPNDVPTNCAVALAVRDVFPKIWVEGEVMDIYHPDAEISATTLLATIDLPEEVTEYIDLFDMTSPEERCQMEEIEFEVEVPDSVINMISLDEIKSLLKNSSTMELVEQ